MPEPPPPHKSLRALGSRLSHMLLLINIIFMLGCQQTIENNTKYLVIPWVFAVVFRLCARYRNILCLAFGSRYSSLATPSVSTWPCARNSLYFYYCFVIAFSGFCFPLAEPETSSCCWPLWEVSAAGGAG